MTSSLMIFDMTFRRTRHGLFSLLVGLVCSLTPEVLFYEDWVMTEALTTFLLVASLWLIIRYECAGKSNVGYRLGLGSIIALAALTRPLIIALVPVYYCFLIPLWPPARILEREAVKKALSFALPPVVLILGWCGFNYFNSGFFTPTTRSGEHLMAQVDPYVDLAPQRFAVLRDAWLQSRELNNVTAEMNASDVYYSALPELERRTGKTETQIAHEYESLALYLQIHHPILCLRRASLGWFQFWGEPSAEEVEWRRGGRARLVEFVVAVANFLVREIEAAFLVLALTSIPCWLFWRKAFTRHEYLIFAIALWVSVFAAFTEFGENRRYCEPLYMLITYTAFTRGWVWMTANSTKRAEITQD